jgi:hypothetical protein
MALGNSVLVTRDGWRVHFVEGFDGPAGARACWEELEGLLPSLRGRHFAGTFDANAGWYRACVRVGSDPSPAEAQLPIVEVPGGRFLRLRLRGEPPLLYERLPAAFEQLHAAGRHDATRPSIEHYRSHELVDALLPVPA